ncbi:hypothetical protein [Paenibacillus sp. BAC0078]
MGMDFTAYVGHSFTENDIYRLCHALSSEKLVYIDQFIKHLYPYNPKDIGKPWQVVPDSIGGTIELNGPCGINLTFSEKVCYFHHYIRWDNFLLDEDIQLYLRKVSYDLANYLAASFAIYVPDSGARESGILDFIWEDKNKDIQFIRDWLLQKCGEPKKRIKDIYKDYGDYCASEGYYIDFFQDLENN